MICTTGVLDLGLFSKCTEIATGILSIDAGDYIIRAEGINHRLGEGTLALGAAEEIKLTNNFNENSTVIFTIEKPDGEPLVHTVDTIDYERFSFRNSTVNTITKSV